MNARATDITTEIASVLRMTYGRDGRWHILVRPEVRLRDDVFMPDVAGWRREQLSDLPVRGAVEVVPDWACEVFSRDEAYRPRIAKCTAYQQAGVHWLWRVFADDGVLEVLRNERGWLVTGAYGDAIARVEPFEGVAFEFDRLFGVYRARADSSSYTSPHSTPASTINAET